MRCLSTSTIAPWSSRSAPRATTRRQPPDVPQGYDNHHVVTARGEKFCSIQLASPHRPSQNSRQILPYLSKCWLHYSVSTPQRQPREYTPRAHYGECNRASVSTTVSASERQDRHRAPPPPPVIFALERAIGPPLADHLDQQICTVRCQSTPNSSHGPQTSVRPVRQCLVINFASNS
jgi:hypothetical protein